MTNKKRGDCYCSSVPFSLLVFGASGGMTVALATLSSDSMCSETGRRWLKQIRWGNDGKKAEAAGW
jgi:hypothetical protein